MEKTKIEEKPIKEKGFIKRPFLMGFVTSIVYLFLSILLFILSFFQILQWIHSLILLLTVILFLTMMASFYYLGKRYNSPLIKTTTILIVILFVASIIIGSVLLINTFLKISEDSELMKTLSAIQKEDQTATKEANLEILSYFKSFFIYLVIFFLCYAILGTLFSIGIFKLKEVKYSNIFSIVFIITLWLPITIIGILFVFPAYIAVLIIQILLFYEQAKKFKEIKNG